MATKEFDFSLGDTKQKSFNVNSVSNQNDQYSNFNLNANLKRSTDNPIHPKNESFHSKSTKNYNVTIVDENDSSRKNNSWSKNNNSFCSNGLNVFDSQKSDTEYQKRWKNEKTSSKDSWSTLSLHIEAYETSVEVEREQNNCDKSLKSKPNVFEIPRQQEDTKGEPEVMQHRASQKLLNPNDQRNSNAGEKGSDAPPTMGSLVSTVCTIRRALATVGMENAINFPQIVVIGTQSHGKSSVIEGIVGRDFLPRGTGICTRRPLLIQLIYTPMDHPKRKEDKKSKNADWATFDHLPDKKFFDFKDVRKEIERATDELLGTKKGVSDEEIYLKIYASNVVDLTLIDLPGFTKVPVGDQPEDIEVRIRDMSLKYISNPNSIILAVVKATEDFATSEALKFAKMVDKNGDRTLGVLTQLDRMDKGTDATKTLTGELIPVKLGIIGVVGRSQADIEAGKTVKECLNDEVEFLKMKYPTLARENGIPWLIKTLNELLLEYIRKTVPDQKIQIAKMTSDYEAILKKLGDPIEESEKDSKLLRVIGDFVSALKDLLDGNSDIVETSRLIGGALLFQVYEESFADEMNAINALEGLDEKAILIAQKNVQGSTAEFLINEKVFRALVRKQLSLLNDPSLKCVDSIHTQLLSIVAHCKTEMQKKEPRFPVLFDKIEDEITAFIKERIEPTKEVIQKLLVSHRNRFNTNHPDFAAPIAKAIKDQQDFLNMKKNNDKPATPAVAASTQQQQQSTGDQQPKKELTEREKKYAELMKDLVKDGFNVVRTSVQDQVPKNCTRELVDYLKEHIHNHLIETFQGIQKDSKNIDLFGEGKSMAQKRKEASAKLVALIKAKEVLNGIPETIL
uniref:Dynamin-1-like protein n=1 Tax=Panagrolaimus sp. PS1159 TaxID=55785 RepID=A0AC35GB19_9BILA